MRLYAPILLALLAVGAHSASLPDVQSETKLVIDDGKSPAENVSNEPELVEPANTVIDVGNNLRNNGKTEDIPVAVIVDVQPVVNMAATEDEPEEIEVKRLLVDLNNPGPPQHQEHETQNPEYYEDAERMVSSVKEEIQESKVVLKEGFQDVTNGIQNWYANNEQINNIQNSINNLQESFSSQLQKLNNTLQLFLKPDSMPLSLEEEKAAEKKIQNIEAGLNNLESNFKAGVQSLSEGVQVVATLKEEATSEASNSGSSSTAAPAQPTNILQLLGQLVSNMQSSMTTSLNNMSTAVNNFVVDYRPNFTLPSLPNLFPQNAATPLADAPVAGSVTTARPSAWQNIQSSFNNLFNPNQAPQNVQNDSPTQAPTGPFGIPPFPIITSIVNLIQRPGAQSTQKPAEAPQANPAPQGSNVVPGPIKPEEIVVKPEAENQPEPSSNPTKKLLEKKPLVDKQKDVETAVTEAVRSEEVKPEEIKPTEVKMEEIKPEEVKVEEVKVEAVKPEEVKPELEQNDEEDEAGQEKGGFHQRPNQGNNNSGDRNNSDSRLDTPLELMKDPEIKEEVKETEQVSEKTE